MMDEPTEKRAQPRGPAGAVADIGEALVWKDGRRTCAERSRSIGTIPIKLDALDARLAAISHPLPWQDDDDRSGAIQDAEWQLALAAVNALPTLLLLVKTMTRQITRLEESLQEQQAKVAALEAMVALSKRKPPTTAPEQSA